MSTFRTKLYVAALLATVVMPTVVQAESPAVSALLKQAEYWNGKGRDDLANQAYRRALAIDPANATARRGLAGQQAKRRPAPQPAQKSVVTQPRPALPAAPKQQSTASRTASASPARMAPVDRGGDARAAGFKALEAGNLATAERNFQSALASRGTDADALGGLGIVRLRAQRFAEAQDLLERASQLGVASKWTEALASSRFYAGMNAAQAAIDNGRPAEAKAIAEQLVASDFTDKEPAYGLLAGIYEQQGQYSEAAALYAKTKGATTTGGADVRLLRVRALEANAAGNATLAEQLFQQGVMADANDPWIRYEFARFLEKRGRRADAEGLRTALRNAREPESLYAAALLSNQMSRPIEAETILDQVPPASRTPEMRDLAVTLKTNAAIARAKQMVPQGRGGQAINGLRQLAATPDLPMASQGALAQAIYDMGDPAGGAMIAQQALNRSGGQLADYESIVRVLAKTGQDGAAMNALQRASDVAGQAPDQRKALARLNGILVATQSDRLRENGQYAQAFDLLQNQWNAAPGDNEILVTLGRLYQSGGMSRQAAQTFRIVLNQDPSDKAALLGLVDAASAAGDYGSASAAANQAITLNPEDYTVYLAAARMEQSRGDERTARKYLTRAKALYTGQSGAMTGGFTANNPFSYMPNGAGRSASMVPAPVNPFDISGSSERNQKPVSYAPASDGYRPMAKAGNGGFGAADSAQQPFPMVSGIGASGFGASGFETSGFGNAPASGGVLEDPVLSEIERDLNGLTSESGLRIDVATSYRERSGETGLSSLKDLGADAQISTDLAGGRVFGKASAAVLDAGEPTGSGLARFGRNPTPEAIGIVAQLPSQLSQAETQNASGVGFTVGYEGKLGKVDVGTTPIGFEKIQFAGGVSFTPRFSRYSSGRVWAERRPVTDSIIAYAGTEDPVTGQFWGAVMKSGGGASYSYDKNGGGVYADASYYRYDGFNVADNNSIQVNIGGYLRAYRDESSTLSVGINLNYQNYDNNQNYFTWGNGGYFSPQSFLSVSFPLRYAYRKNALELNADVSAGYQSYNQDSALIYPTDPSAQAVLNQLKAQNDDVRAQFDSLSQTGFGLALSGMAYYNIDPATRLGGQVSLNTFGAYNELRSTFGIKRQIGGQE